MLTERQKQNMKTKIQNKVFSMMDDIIDYVNIDEYIDEGYIKEKIERRISYILKTEVESMVDNICSNMELQKGDLHV